MCTIFELSAFTTVGVLRDEPPAAWLAWTLVRFRCMIALSPEAHGLSTLRKCANLSVRSLCQVWCARFLVRDRHDAGYGSAGDDVSAHS